MGARLRETHKTRCRAWPPSSRQALRPAGSLRQKRRAMLDQARGYVRAAGDDPAEIDMARERDQAQQFDAAVIDRSQAFISSKKGGGLSLESLRVAMKSKAKLVQMGKEIAEIDGRVAFCVEVQIEQPDAISINQDLIGVE